MIIYLSFYTIAYLGCPLGFQAFARGLRGYGPQATGSPASIVYRPYALSQMVAPGSCTKSSVPAIETDQILTNEQKVCHCPFCCLWPIEVTQLTIAVGWCYVVCNRASFTRGCARAGAEKHSNTAQQSTAAPWEGGPSTLH